jgi:hypothetical protein
MVTVALGEPGVAGVSSGGVAGRVLSICAISLSLAFPLFRQPGRGKAISSSL